jgi:D-alanyl-D-alanine dipeptidase
MTRQIALSVPLLLALALGFVAPLPVLAQSPALPADFVYLRDIDPSIEQDIRYAGANNFIGRPLAGYSAAECIVKRPIADALARVQRQLAVRNLSLKMFDCYRPDRAVQDMLAWSKDPAETQAQHNFNPKLRKQDLFRLGYIAVHSGHSTGAAVDLSIVDRRAPGEPAFDPHVAYADCTAPVALRAPGDGVDMGTGYDCSDEKAHTLSPNIDARQKASRALLVKAMASEGFVNFRLEWWHFSLPGVSGPGYDFPILPRR